MPGHARTGIVQSVERVTTDDGLPLVEITVDAGGGELLTLEHFADGGEDSLPLPGDVVAISDSTGAGALRASGYVDTKNAGEALGGEKRIYGRVPDGSSIAGFVRIHGDGVIEIKGLAAGESYKIGKVLIDKDGNITTPGEITAKAGTPALVTLTQHTHPTGTGPSGPAIPGA